MENFKKPSIYNDNYIYSSSTSAEPVNYGDMKEKMENKTIEQRIDEASLKYTNTDYFKLEYTSFGKTAQECWGAFKAGVEFGRELERERSHQLNIALGEIAKKALKAYEESGK